jgi:hypothetical protein
MMETIRTSETSVYYNENTRRNNPEGSNLHTLYTLILKLIRMWIAFHMVWRYVPQTPQSNIFTTYFNLGININIFRKIILGTTQK